MNHWQVNVDSDEIAWLTFNQANSSMNTLNEDTLRELNEAITQLSSSSIKALVIQSGKSSGFIAGADITQFKNFSTPEEARAFIQKGQEIFNRLEQITYPTIALISGVCLGGGLELALACRYRIVEDSPKKNLGLPEVKLGIHPGWGGTVRLPKLIGSLSAFDLILSGRTIDPKTAKRLGIANEVVAKRLLTKTAKIYALNPPARTHLPFWQASLNQPWARWLISQYLMRQLKQKISPTHYPAPFHVVENWARYGVGSEAMRRELDSISSLATSETAQNLVRIFFLQEQLKSFGKKVECKFTHVHVVGAGVMGGDIAAWCALRGFKVTLQDQAPLLIGKAYSRAVALATKQFKEKHLIQAMMDRFIPDPNGTGVKQADVIIEAISEKLEAKRALFSALEKEAKSDAILATNTSTIPLEEISQGLMMPERLVGIHFFNPVAKMPLVEIVKGNRTESKWLALATAFVCKIDKLPLPVKSAPGFLVNRILLPYMLEAVLLLEEGVSPTLIDKAAVEFGMPMGPIELADTVGLDICLAALEKLSPNDNSPGLQKLRQLVSQGNLGRKTGKGFYDYQQSKLIKPNNTPSAPVDVTDRLIFRLLNEAMGCLRENIVENADLIDAGSLFGFGFPPFRGGVMHYANKLSQEAILKKLEILTNRYGDRFTPDKGWYEQTL